MKKTATTPIGQRLAYLTATHLKGHGVELVALSFHEGQLKIFLRKWKRKEQWGLPISLIKKEESFENAVIRLIEDSYGIKNAFIKSIGVFSHPDRTTPSWLVDYYEENLKKDELYLLDWVKGRFITTSYLSFVGEFLGTPPKTILYDEFGWFALDSIPDLIQDHSCIVEQALRQLRIELSYLPVTKELLSSAFTLPELQKVYEAILGRKLDRANFQRKMLKLGYLVRLDRKKEGFANRAPYLYTIDEAIYEQYMQHGIGYL